MRAWLIAFLTFCSSAACAAPSLVDQIASQANATTVLRASFVQTKTMAALRRPLVSTGQLLLSRDQGLAWHIEAPLRATYLLSERGVTEIDAQGARRTRDAREMPGLEYISRTFQALLAGNMDALRESFDIEAQGTREAWRLVLLPRQRQTAAFLRQLELTGGRHVERITVVEAQGDRTVMQMSHIRSDTALTAAETAQFTDAAERR